MYRKVLKFDKTEVEIIIFSSPVVETEGTAIFGFPLDAEETLLGITNENFGNTVKGIWLKLDWNASEIKILTDILGGFRVYYYEKNNSITISDDHKYLIQKKGIKPEKNKQEFSYWKKHKYTSGSSTLFKKISKISPATQFIVNSKGVFQSTYFKDLHRNTSIEKHKTALNEDLNNTFSKIKNNQHKIILLFSGGKDSCLLLQYLLKNDVEFIPVFFKLNPLTKHGAGDLIKVRKISKELGLDLKEIEIDINEISESYKAEIIEKQLFDMHFSLLHYYGNKILTKKYGKNILLVNGQSSDNIFSFGPSENSFMSFFRRNIMYSPESLISKIGILLLIVKTRKLFRFPKNELEKLFAIFDDYKYTRVIESKLDQKYYDYFIDLIKLKTESFESFYSKEMYCRVLSYCQGSDNQVVVNSARHYGVNVIMPFATPNIIYSTIKFKDEKLEIRNPKYVVDEILKEEFGFDYESLIKKSKEKLSGIKYIKQSANYNFKEEYDKALSQLCR